MGSKNLLRGSFSIFALSQAARMHFPAFLLRLPTLSALSCSSSSQAMHSISRLFLHIQYCTPFSIGDPTSRKKSLTARNLLSQSRSFIPHPPLPPGSLTPPSSLQRSLKIPLRNPPPRPPPRHEPRPHPRLRPRPPPRLPPPRRPKPGLHGPARPLPPHGLPLLARHPAAVPALAERAERGGERGGGDGAADGGDQVWG